MSSIPNIFLIGLPGVGKTTVGKKLAQKLSLPFLDSDQLIEEQMGLSCREIWEQKGEDYFRAVESELLIKLPKEGHIIALGGGVVCLEKNRHLLRNWGIKIHLTDSIETLARRKKSAVYLGKWGYAALAEARLPLYRELAAFEFSLPQITNEGLEVIHHHLTQVARPLPSPTLGYLNLPRSRD